MFGLATLRKLPSGRSFGDILAANKGVGEGFDHLRIGLSLMILLSHTSGIIGTRGLGSSILASLFGVSKDSLDSLTHFTVSTGAAAAANAVTGSALTGLARPITLSYVPMFFALSGFLVTASALRTTNAVRFLSLRVIRIAPALLVEVVLSALLLGAVFTTLPLSSYFTHERFYTYFLNILGIVQFDLPGVFVGTSNSPNVNSNLWTLPPEFKCYAILGTLIVLGALSWRTVLTVLFIVVTIAFAIGNTFYDFAVTNAQLGPLAVVYYFLTGMMVYLWRDHIRYNVFVMLVFCVLTYALMMSTRTVFIYPLMLTYITVFIGLTPLPKSKFLKSGDYSYGVYLYGYPITQAVVATFPTMKGNYLFIASISVTLTIIAAYFSWHCVEKHFLKLKRFVSERSFRLTQQIHPQTEGEKPSEPLGAPNKIA